ncbi:GNAT family N-acetyltransferase [Enterococcus rotai]|uniref:GNAT family N-acetyltransferase n=1 Tax=Enterococcus rotai TaxID=118060 RepID=UPI0035C6BD13
MKDFTIVKIKEHPELLLEAAEWFHQKWKIPIEAYIQSMEECINSTASVPQCYIVRDDKKIVAGIGVIENDFHDRKDLTPNICAVYVEDSYRNQGLAGNMLQFVCDDFKNKGNDYLYLITDHSTFYERYDWEFICMVQGDGELTKTRMYRREL